MKDKFGWGAAGVHALVFFSLSKAVFSAIAKGPKAAEDALAYTLIVLWPDVPAMIGAGILAEPTKKIGAAAFVPSFMLFLFIFASLQWYGIGKLVGLGWKKLNPPKP